MSEKRNRVVKFIAPAVLVMIMTFLYGDAGAVQEKRRLLSDIPRNSGRQIHYQNREYSEKEFSEIKKAELAKFRDSLREMYGLDFKVRSAGYFNIAYRCPESTMNHLQEYLLRFYEQVYPRFFIYEPSSSYQIVYFENKALYGKKTGMQAYGFYSFDVRMLVTYAHSGHGTLWHELIHAFVDDNTSSRHQQWFSEGFASFYEMAFLKNGRVDEGYANWRLPQLQEVIRNGDYTPLRKFISKTNMSEYFGYPEARYIFCYLWMHNRMDDFVKSYMYDLSVNYEGDELKQKVTAKVEEFLGKDIDSADGEFKAFVLGLKKNQKLNRYRYIH